MFKDHLIQFLGRTVVMGLLVGLFWWPGSSAVRAQTVLATPQTITLENARLEALIECLPKQLTGQNEDFQERVTRAFGEMTHDYLERTFALTNNPQLNQAEAELESCLQAKGFVPQRQANS